MSLKQKLLELIEINGPISVSQYMAHCLYDSQFGYYRNSKPIGKDGDFITAPEISQLFGECIAIFIVTHWNECSKANEINLIEFGPGRGTLMRDIVKTLEKAPSFDVKINIHLLESNAQLKQIQSEVLSNYHIEYYDDISALPNSQDIPNYLIANEFLDCLPINQYICQNGIWHEKLIGSKNDELVFGLSSPFALGIKNAPDGAVYEIAPSLQSMISKFCELIRPNNGAAIIFDYGYEKTEFANTLQALRHHQKCDVFNSPGDCDLTAHVDFAAIKKFATDNKVFSQGIMSQSDFLNAFGIHARAESLMRQNPDRADEIKAGLERLTSNSHMGELFKTIVLHL